MRERIDIGYDSFVLPFTVGMVLLLIYLLTGVIRIFIQLSGKNKIKLIKHIFSPGIFKTIKDIIADCLIHVKIFKKNFLLGYMHASIAFGWFMLIVIGHIEVWLYTPQRTGVLYYPIFFHYFVMETNYTLHGSLFFFLMDFFLLMVLSGIAIAIFKRFKSKKIGMKKTTNHAVRDKIALYSLWAIFPLRLLAESYTADISGGSFLTKSLHIITGNDPLITQISWWAYSISLGIFMLTLPFSRYMHIPTEMLLILLRNAGIRSANSRNDYAETEIYSCSSCGICLDGCPMTNINTKKDYAPVYYLRSLRRREQRALSIAENCLICGKCGITCPVGVDSSSLRLHKRRENFNSDFFSYDYLHSVTNTPLSGKKVLYYAGCMTHLAPAIHKSLFRILDNAGVVCDFMDKDSQICCGRPLILAGGKEKASSMIHKNTEIIRNSGAEILLLSCPICYKVFREEYRLSGLEIIHHTEYLWRLIDEGSLVIDKSDISFVYHDPCDLGRGSGIYEQPRKVLEMAGKLKRAVEERELSICCGRSIGSTKFCTEERDIATKNAIESLLIDNPDILVTSCPLCLKTFSPLNRKKTLDIAQVIERQMKQK